MDFKLSTIEDIDAIFKFYDWAVAFQKEKFNKHWKGFERSLIEKEIQVCDVFCEVNRYLII